MYCDNYDSVYCDMIVCIVIWLGDGFPTVVLKGCGKPLNLGDEPMVLTYFTPHGLSLARRWI